MDYSGISDRMKKTDSRICHIRIVFYIHLLILSAVSPLLSGCGDELKEMHRALYEWRSHITYSPADFAAFDSLGITKLYVRFFDVQWRGERNQPYPASVATFGSPLPKGVEIIPTVYVTVDVMRRAHEEFSPAELAERITGKIESMASDIGLPVDSIREIQLDCDWTASTRTAYFELLSEVKEKRPEWTLSATIRLHQIRYRVETGIPPVDRGMLMAYNVGQVTAPEEKNSIFTEEEVGKYLGPLDESPLPLDVALPIFSWGVRFHFDRFAAVIDGVRLSDMRGRPEFERFGENLWRARTNTELRGEPISAGDVIRVEEPDREGVLSVARRVAGDLDDESLTVSLYRFDRSFMNDGFDYFQETYRAFE